MKIKLDGKVLADAVAWVARYVPQRPTVPVLGGVLLEAEGENLTLSAFDYDVSARVDVSPDAVHEPGRVLLPGRLLAQVVASLPPKTVELTLAGNEVELRCGTGEFTLLTMPADEYPTLPAPPETLGTVDGGLFRTACGQVVPAADPNAALVMLAGVRFDVDSAGLEIAATDRYRIAARKLNWQPALPDASAGALIPAKVLHDLARGLGSGPVEIGLDDKQAAFTEGGRRTTARLIDSEYINYRGRLTSDHLPIVARVEVAAVVETIKRVAVFAEKAAPVRLAFTQGQVVVSAGGGDVGRGAEVVDAELAGDDLEIAFQPQYILASLEAVEGDWAHIAMATPTKPALITGEDPAFRYLVMALRQS